MPLRTSGSINGLPCVLNCRHGGWPAAWKAIRLFGSADAAATLFSTDINTVTRFVTTDGSLRIAAANAAAGVPGGRAGSDVRPERGARARAAGPAGGAPGGQPGRRRRAAPAPPHAPPQASLLYLQHRLRRLLIPCPTEAVVQRRARSCTALGRVLLCCARPLWQLLLPAGSLTAATAWGPTRVVSRELSSSHVVLHVAEIWLGVTGNRMTHARSDDLMILEF